MIAAPRSRSGPLIVVGSTADASGEWCCWCNESSPFRGRPVSYGGEINPALLAATVRAIYGILVREPSNAVSELMSNYSPVDPHRHMRTSATTTATEVGIVKNDQDLICVRHPLIYCCLQERLSVFAVLQPAVRP